MPDLLFVYGTLRPNCAPAEIAAVAAQLRPAGNATVRGKLYDLGHYPGGILCDHQAHSIFGVLFELPSDQSILCALDAYEECIPERPESSQFLRVRCNAVSTSGDSVSCWIYVYARDLAGVPHIESGVWRAPAR